MPRKKSQLSRATSSARRMRYIRSLEDHEQRENRLLKARLRGKARRLKESLVSSLVNDADDEQLNEEIIATNIVEITMPESKSDEEDSDRQNIDENSKETNRDKEQKSAVNKVRETTSRDKGCSFSAKIKIEKTETNPERLDCTVEEEEK